MQRILIKFIPMGFDSHEIGFPRDWITNGFDCHGNKIYSQMISFSRDLIPMRINFLPRDLSPMGIKNVVRWLAIVVLWGVDATWTLYFRCCTCTVIEFVSHNGLL